MLKNNAQKIKIYMFYCCVMMFTFSLSSSMYSSLAPYIINHYGTSLTESSLFTISSSIGTLLVNIIIMRIGDRFNKGKMLAVLSLIMTCSLLLISSAPVMALYLVVNCINGMVGYWMDNLTTAYVSDLYGEDRGRYIGILYTLFAVAGAVAPTFNTIVLGNLGMQWCGSYRIVGFFMMITAVSYLGIILLMGTPDVRIEESEQINEGKITVMELARNRNMLALILSGITMAFYGYFSSMLPTYFSFTEPETYTLALRNFILTCYTVGQMISRFLYIPLAKLINPIRYLRIQSLICSLSSLVCIIVNKPVIWMVLMFISGILSGSSFTMTTVLTCDEYPNNSSSASAARGFASGIAFLLATPIMNIIADNTTFFIAMVIPIFFGLLTFFIYRYVYVEKK